MTMDDVSPRLASIGGRILKQTGAQGCVIIVAQPHPEIPGWSRVTRTCTAYCPQDHVDETETCMLLDALAAKLEAGVVHGFELPSGHRVSIEIHPEISAKEASEHDDR